MGGGSEDCVFLLNAASNDIPTDGWVMFDEESRQGISEPTITILIGKILLALLLFDFTTLLIMIEGGNIAVWTSLYCDPE